MELKNEHELAATHEKIRALEARLRQIQEKTDGDAHVRELTLRSLRGVLKQLREEAVRYQASRTTATTSTS